MKYALLRSDSAGIQTVVAQSEDHATRILAKIVEMAKRSGGTVREVSEVRNGQKVKTGLWITNSVELDGTWSIGQVPDTTVSRVADVLNHSRKLPDTIGDRNRDLRAEYSHDMFHALKDRAYVAPKDCTVCNGTGTWAYRLKTGKLVTDAKPPKGQFIGKHTAAKWDGYERLVCPACKGTGEKE